MTNHQFEVNARPDVVRSKHIYGIWYGVTLGAAFSIFTWGLDAYQLSHLHGLLPWVRFGTGAILCMVPGGITGWLSARGEKPIWSMLLWAATASLFAWLTISLPIRITPQLIGILEPDIREYLHLAYYADFSTRVGVAYAWIAIFTSLAGLLQIPLSDSAVFSSSIFGKIAPFFLCFILMLICGTNADSLINDDLRSAVQGLDSTLQFYVDNQGKTVDLTLSRQHHLGALREISDVITPERKMMVSGYDQYLGQVDVVVKFENVWVECRVIYNQPSSCKEILTAH